MLWTRKGMTWISSKSTMLLSIPQNGVRNICGCSDLFRLFVPLSLVDRQFLHPWEHPHHSLSKLQESTGHGEHRWRALTAARAEETPQNVPQLRSEHGESISAQRRPTEHRSQATVHMGTAVLSTGAGLLSTREPQCSPNRSQHRLAPHRGYWEFTWVTLKNTGTLY